MTPPPPLTPERALPDQRKLLWWVLGARMIAAAVLLIFAAGSWAERPGMQWLAGGSALYAAVLAAWASWVLRRPGAAPGDWFHAAQASADIALITAMVHGPGPASGVPSLYILVIAAYALLMSLGGGLLVALAIVAAYFADTMLPRRSVRASPSGARSACSSPPTSWWARWPPGSAPPGSSGRSLEIELRRVRLEADEILRHIRSGVMTVDDAGRLAFINPMAERLLQIDGETVDRAAGARQAQVPLARAVGGDRRRHPPRPQGEPGRGHGAA